MKSEESKQKVMMMQPGMVYPPPQAGQAQIPEHGMGFPQGMMTQPGMGFQRGMHPNPNMIPIPGFVPNPKYDKIRGASYSPEADAESLYKAMKGAGTNENTIIQILCNRTLAQRLLIKEVFEKKYNKDLIKELKSELSGKFEDAVIASFRTTTELDCKALYDAMHGLGTDEETLVEILCTRSNYQIQLDIQEFPKLYKKDLIKFVESETSGVFRKVLKGFLSCTRSENPRPDPGFCQQETERLYKAGEGKWGTDEAVFIKTITERSPSELAMIAELYQKNYNHSLYKAIDKEFSGETKKLLNQIIMAIISPSEYFAERIYKSMKGIGTKDAMLIRCLVSRDEIDMPQIKNYYRTMYKKEMIDAIKSDTSGHYEKFLVELCGH